MKDFKKKRDTLEYLALVTQVGLTVVISAGAGLFVGLYLDRRLGTSVAFTLLFLVLGLASGLWQAYLALMRVGNEADRRRED